MTEFPSTALPEEDLRAGTAGQACRKPRRCLLLFELGVLLAEAVDAAGSVKEALLASEEGMAGRADFDMHLFALGGKDLLAVAAGTSDCGLVDFGLDIFFHHNLYKCYLKCRTYRHLELSLCSHRKPHIAPSEVLRT